jgi:hypothetical protein
MISEFYLIFCSYCLHYFELFFIQGQKPLAKTPPNGSRSPTGYQLFSRDDHENTAQNFFFPWSNGQKSQKRTLNISSRRGGAPGPVRTGQFDVPNLYDFVYHIVYGNFC